ncbi:MAG: aminotransferase class III-fold pyridoxal phosphate-dependent enzyme [Pseudomonadota bacterium]
MTTPARRFDTSLAWLTRAERSIPLGSQTFSKSRLQFPPGVSPLFIERGHGATVWDADGNSYVDFVNGLLAVMLGYGDADVDRAVRAQLDNGVIFSLPHRLEMEVAEKVIAMVPCAERVRFGKNGSDATAGAVRLARAYTGRDRVAVCGYHGWQDWYIGATARHKGVPQATRALTHVFPYNDAERLDDMLGAHPGAFAAVILEPMNTTQPLPGYLAAVRDIAHRHGALLIFDETITGFRFAKGGAQELFGVTPDLATFGKGLANGFPLSLVCGRADIMALMEDIFFSFTMGGETLSLAAANAVLDKIASAPVVETLAATGGQVMEGLGARIAAHGLHHIAKVAGHPSWSFFLLSDCEGATAWEMKTLFLQEMFARGVLTLGTHNISYAHGPAEVARLLDAYDEVLDVLAMAIKSKNVRARLRCPPLEPVFKVR